MVNINDEIFKDTNSGSNEGQVLKQKLLSIVASKEVQAEEAENIKEIKKDLKLNHELPPALVNKLVNILMDPSKMSDYDNEYASLLDVLNKLKVKTNDS